MYLIQIDAHRCANAKTLDQAGRRRRFAPANVSLEPQAGPTPLHPIKQHMIYKCLAVFFTLPSVKDAQDEARRWLTAAFQPLLQLWKQLHVEEKMLLPPPHCHIRAGLVLTGDFKLILKQPLNFLTLFLRSFEVQCTERGTARLRGSAPLGWPVLIIVHSLMAMSGTIRGKSFHQMVHCISSSVILLVDAIACSDIV